MKSKILLIGLFIGLTSTLFAQSQPIDFKYCYSFYGAYGETFNAHLTKIGDTLIQDRPCAIMDYPFQYNLRYLWYDDSKIYRYSESKDSFFLLYDFDLTPGEILTIDLGFRSEELGSDAARVRYLITDINYEEWNGVVLRVQQVEKIDDPGTELFVFGERLIEGIGSESYFVPYSQGDEIWANLKEAVFESGPVFETNACIGSSTEEAWSTVPTLNVTPNPFTNEFHIELPDQKNGVGDRYYLSIINLLGAQVFAKEHQAGELVDFSDLENGLYILFMSNNEGVVGKSKLVKQ